MPEYLPLATEKLKEVGRVVASATVPTHCEEDVPLAVHFDLRPALQEGLGHAIVFIWPDRLAFAGCVV
jgi:hypothetical protein